MPDAVRRQRRLDYSLDVEADRRDPTLLRVSASHLLREETWYGRRVAIRNVKRQYGRRRNTAEKLGRAVLYGAMGAAMGAAMDEPDPSTGSEGTSPLGLLLFGYLGARCGWESVQTHTETVQTGRVREETQTLPSLEYPAKPDEVLERRLPSASLPVRASVAGGLLSTRGTPPAREITFRTDDAGRASVRIEGLPLSWAPTAAESAARATNTGVGRLARGDAALHIRTALAASARALSHDVAFATLETDRKTEELTETVRNAFVTHRLSGFAASPDEAVAAARDFAPRILKERLMEIAIELRDLDTRTSVRGAVVTCNARAPDASSLLARYFDEGLLETVVSGVPEYTRGEFRALSEADPLTRTFLVPGTELDISVEHPQYFPHSSRRVLRPGEQRVVVDLRTFSGMVDQEINSKVKPLTIVVKDIDSRTAVRGVRYAVEIDSPSPGALLARKCAQVPPEKLISFVKPYGLGRQEGTASDGRLAFKVFAEDARVTLTVGRKGYHELRATFELSGSSSKKTVYLTDDSQEDRSYVADE